MLKKIPRFWKGYVKIRLESGMPERFLSLCAHHRILLWNLKNKDLYYEMELSVRDFFRLKPLRKKTGSRIVLLEKHGLPFFFQKNQKRKAFFLGFFLGAALLFFCSLFIWDIQVEGNHYYAKEEVLKLLGTLAVENGIPKREVDCKKIADGIREGFPHVVWVSAKIEGTCLMIEMKENEESFQEKEKKKDGETGWDLVAEENGTIVSMVTRAGKPLVQEGMECEKGQVLVSGELEILNNDEQVQRYEYVEADAEIWIETEYAYYDEFSLTHLKRIYTEEEKTYPVVRLFGRELTLWKGKETKAEVYQRETPVYLTPSFCLPVSYGTIRVHPYRVVEETDTEQEAEEKAHQRIQRFLKRLVEEKIQVMDQQIQIKISGQTCTAKGRVTVRKQVKKKEPTEHKQVPEL